jgi:ABC-type multidrug transport system fused ATPase/permease subunit
MQKSKVAFQRVQEVLDLPIEPEDDRDYADLAPDQMAGPVEFRSVSFSYTPGEPVLSNLSFSIPEGRTTALVGPSGVGKSTICHLLMRLMAPDEGEILVNGIDLRRISSEQLKKSICIVSQDIFLFHTTVYENIRYGKPQAEIDEVIRAAKAACIHDYISRLPGGYDTVVGDRGATLSGGQKQRVCIARAFLTNPKILILDEASAFLDPDVESQLKQTMRFLMKGRTILVVSHRKSSIEDVDKIVALGKDGLLYEGPPEEYALEHERQDSHNR